MAIQSMRREEVVEDVWLPTTCDMCFNRCNIRVRRVNGVVVKIEGLDAPPNNGKTCAKGNAAVMSLYNPNRVTTPLVRTNPKKGIGVDPGWREISWEKAMELMTEKVGAARAKDPRTIALATFDTTSQQSLRPWMAALGSPNQTTISAGFFCGNGVHPIAFAMTGAFDVHYDIERCNFFLMFGTSWGFVNQREAMGVAQEMADARMRGMKLVVVDPICTNSASQADEWIPIRPGTDTAFCLAMQHVLVNELGLYDAEFLRRYTNAPYLTGPDGHYVRDPREGKPLVWDARNSRAAAFDVVEPLDCALEGTFQLEGIQAKPGFQLIKEHLPKWTPEKVADITTVRAATIRRLATEFGEAASIGSKIILDGYELPHRPAAASWYRGTSAHKHGLHSCMSIAHLNVLVGAIDVPGGMCHSGGTGPTWGPVEGPDGLLVQGPGPRSRKAPHSYDFQVRKPETLELVELFPLAIYARAMLWLGVLYGEKFGLDYKPEVLIVCRSNPLATSGDPEIMGEAFRQIPFIISMSVFQDETTQFADLLLPDTHALERLVPLVSKPYVDGNSPPQACQPVTYRTQLPVVKAQGQARYWIEVLYELADRLGFRQDIYSILNTDANLKGPHRLDPERKYTFEEIFDRSAKSSCGDEHGLEYFKRVGYCRGAKYSAREAFPRVFHKARVPLYLEHFLTAGEQVRSYMDSRGIDWDTSDYVPLIHWQPCPAASQANKEYDLYVVNQKLPILTFSFTAENPWLKEIADHSGKVYTVAMNSATAQRKGINDTDMIELETPSGYRVQAVVRLTQGIHPECLSVPGILGRRVTSGAPRSKKGVHYNSLLRYDVDRLDTVSCALDACVKVKVRKVKSANGRRA